MTYQKHKTGIATIKKCAISSIYLHHKWKSLSISISFKPWSSYHVRFSEIYSPYFNHFPLIAHCRLWDSFHRKRATRPSQLQATSYRSFRPPCILVLGCCWYGLLSLGQFCLPQRYRSCPPTPSLKLFSSGRRVFNWWSWVSASIQKQILRKTSILVEIL